MYNDRRRARALVQLPRRLPSGRCHFIMITPKRENYDCDFRMITPCFASSLR